MSEIFQQQFPNGLWLVAELIPSAQSLSMTFLTPAGVVYEPSGQQGLGAILTELLCRGAGGLSARQHSDALGQLGVQRGISVHSQHIRLSATMIGTKADDALPLLFDMIRRPNLEEASVQSSKDLAIQAIDGLMDEPQQRVMIELRNLHYPDPLGRSPYGKRDDLERIGIDQLRHFWQHQFLPGGSILAFAGQFDYSKLSRLVTEQLGDWHGQVDLPEILPGSAGQYRHIEAETAQVHLALAYDTVAEPDQNSILQRAAGAVLSGGMSSRLFTEVREKRGLCYAVAAMYAGHKTHGAMLVYAGTVINRAQETYDVLQSELSRLSEGIEPDEFERAIVGMKSRLVMQGESTNARASAIADDQYLLDRPRSLDEIASRVDGITLDDLNTFVCEHRPREMTAVSIGPGALQVGG